MLVGASYKPGVGDTRESPALKIMRLLGELGADLSYHDPHVPELRDFGLRSVALEVDASSADLVAIVTAHPEVDYERLVAEAQLVIDFRGVTRGISAENLVRLVVGDRRRLPHPAEPAGPGEGPLALAPFGARHGRARGRRFRDRRDCDRRPVRAHAATARVASPEESDGVVEAAPAAALDTVGVAVEGYAAAPRSETVLFNLLAGFLGAFGFIRLSTYGIRGGWWPFGNTILGGQHIHHFVPGILIAFGSGTAALLTDDDAFEDKLAVPMGVGMGLTFDEAALLLDLRDVYWTREGLLSVQVSFALTAMLAAAILALRMLQAWRAPPGGGGCDPAWPAGHAAKPSAIDQAAFSAGRSPIQTTCSRSGPTPTSRIGTPTNSLMKRR